MTLRMVAGAALSRAIVSGLAIRSDAPIRRGERQPPPLLGPVRRELGGAVGAFAMTGELDLVSRDLALVRHLHGIALHVHRHVERDLVALHLAVRDLHVALTPRHGAGELLAGRLEVEG